MQYVEFVIELNKQKSPELSVHKTKKKKTKYLI